MSGEIWALVLAAGWLALFHTIIGPDHYVPFVVMAKARNWSLPRTAWLTFLCGLGHVLSSVILGGIGIAVGIALGSLEWFEESRGNIAGWLLTGFGLLYMLWGIRRAILNKPHSHVHLHADGEHIHTHTHDDDHVHVHTDEAPSARKPNLTPWILFTIFVFGPCEPLIPLLMFPAAKLSVVGVVAVAAVFSIVTIATMLAAVLALTFGLAKVPMTGLQRYTHALAGAAILACGVLIRIGL